MTWCTRLSIRAIVRFLHLKRKSVQMVYEEMTALFGEERYIVLNCQTRERIRMCLTREVKIREKNTSCSFPEKIHLSKITSRLVPRFSRISHKKNGMYTKPFRSMPYWWGNVLMVEMRSFKMWRTSVFFRNIHNSVKIISNVFYKMLWVLEMGGQCIDKEYQWIKF